MNRKIRYWSAVLLLLPQIVGGTELEGRVEILQDDNVQVMYLGDGRAQPSPGDEVTFFKEIQGLEANAGSGSVSRLEPPNLIWVDTDKGRHEPGMRARIQASGAAQTATYETELRNCGVNKKGSSVIVLAEPLDCRISTGLPSGLALNISSDRARFTSAKLSSGDWGVDCNISAIADHGLRSNLMTLKSAYQSELTGREPSVGLHEAWSMRSVTGAMRCLALWEASQEKDLLAAVCTGENEPGGGLDEQGQGRYGPLLTVRCAFARSGFPEGAPEQIFLDALKSLEVAEPTSPFVVTALGTTAASGALENYRLRLTGALCCAPNGLTPEMATVDLALPTGLEEPGGQKRAGNEYPGFISLKTANMSISVEVDSATGFGTWEWNSLDEFHNRPGSRVPGGREIWRNDGFDGTSARCLADLVAREDRHSLRATCTLATSDPPRTEGSDGRKRQAPTYRITLRGPSAILSEDLLRQILSSIRIQPRQR